MPSKYRNRAGSPWLHVYNRGADRQDIFSLDGDWEVFETLLGDLAIEFGVEVHAYVLMTNHFHLLVHDPSERLGELMHRLCGAYAQLYNERTNRTGPLFTGRFSSVPVTSDVQRVVSARYIHRNPSELVGESALPAYRYSSLGCYLGRRAAPTWLTMTDLGGIDDVRFVAEGLLDRHPGDRLPFEFLPPLRPTTPDELGAAIECSEAVPGAARLLEMTLALELRVDTLPRLAEWFGITSESLRRGARRGRVLLDTDPAFRQLRERVMDFLAAA